MIDSEIEREKKADSAIVRPVKWTDDMRGVGGD